MDFDERNAYAKKSIANGDAGMRECSRVDDNAIDILRLGLMNPVNQGALMIALECGDFNIQAVTQFDQLLIDISQCLCAVMTGLTCPQKVQVGAM